MGPTKFLRILIVTAVVALAALTWIDGGSNNLAGGVDSAPQTAASTGRVVSVSWVDGDSGRINGREFRLHGVDAPEGSPSRAQCEFERKLSSKSRTAAQNLTRNRRVVVTRSHGEDRYGRELVDLSVDGQSVAAELIASRHVKRWNFEAGEEKPNWCR